jgi:hypothetical protein
MLRDKGRMTSLKKAVEYINASSLVMARFPNRKHCRGFITCFKPLLLQLESIQSIQIFKFYGKLPVAYLFRCRQFNEFMSSLENSFELLVPGLKGLAALMNRLKNFDAAKVYYPLYSLTFPSFLYPLLFSHFISLYIHVYTPNVFFRRPST